MGCNNSIYIFYLLYGGYMNVREPTHSVDSIWRTCTITLCLPHTHTHCATLAPLGDESLNYSWPGNVGGG